jgi:hypothetical protein
MNRREFIIGTIALLDFFLIRGCGEEGEEYFPPYFSPETEEEKTIYALCETVVPGRQTDPDGEPGAIEAGAMLVLNDRDYPAKDYISGVAGILNITAISRYKKKFHALEMEEREEVLGIVEDAFYPISLLIRFIKASFFDALVNDVGYRYLNYPGPNLGYIDDKDFGFRKKMSEELTDDGSLP